MSKHDSHYLERFQKQLLKPRFSILPRQITKPNLPLAYRNKMRTTPTLITTTLSALTLPAPAHLPDPNAHSKPTLPSRRSATEFGALTYCLDEDFQGQCNHDTTNAGNRTCTNLEAPWYRSISSVWPDPGTRCDFWSNRHCNGLILSIGQEGIGELRAGASTIRSRASRVVRGRGGRRELQRKGSCIRIAGRIREGMGLERGSEENGSEKVSIVVRGRGGVRLG